MKNDRRGRSPQAVSSGLMQVWHAMPPRSSCIRCPTKSSVNDHSPFVAILVLEAKNCYTIWTAPEKVPASRMLWEVQPSPRTVLSRTVHHLGRVG